MRPFLCLLAAVSFSLPALAAPAIDNDRVTVWDIKLQKGESGPPAPTDKDTLVMFLEGGVIRTASGGKTTTAVRKFGDAVWIAKGASDTLVSGGPAHEIMVALKDHAEPPTPNHSGLPLAFPRPGSVKVLENPRVIVWRYSWSKGRPTPMHFHDKDVVVAYRYDGTLQSTTPDGAVTVNPYRQGEIRFNKADRTHSELLTTARQSAVIVELK
jgi:hypothetical protein